MTLVAFPISMNDEAIYIKTVIVNVKGVVVVSLLFI